MVRRTRPVPASPGRAPHARQRSRGGHAGLAREGERMPLDPIVAAVEGGGYVSLLKLLPAVVVLAIWGRLLTWMDKDAEAAHLPRVALNISFLSGLVLAFALFFFLPTFIIAFAALLFVFAAEAGTYLILRQQKVGLKDLSEQFGAWVRSFSAGKKEAKLPPSQVGIIGKGGAQFPA